MMRPTGHSVVITAMVVATIVAIATTEDADDSTSDENLRQALVLVNILKSGILRRSQNSFAATPSSLADFAGHRPWPPYAPFNGYGPFRRMNDKDEYERRKDSNMTRQMEYEDQFGPHPGGDAPSTPEKATKGSVNPTTKPNSIQPPEEDKVASKEPTSKTEATVAETKTVSTREKESNPSSKANTTQTAAKKPAATEKNTKTTKSQITSGKPSEKGKTKKPRNIYTKSRNKNTKIDMTNKRVSPLTKSSRVGLKYKKNSKAINAIKHKKADEAELSEAVMELKREAADVGNQHRCAARRTPSAARRTPSEPSQTPSESSQKPSGPGRKPSGSSQKGATRKVTQASCVGPNCNGVNATQATTVHFKATTRVYLSRSVRPQIPLPANNAFCYTNPENALCRTLI